MSVRATLLSLAITTSAEAQENIYQWPYSRSNITLHETDELGAVAAVTFRNGLVGGEALLNFSLTLDGFTVAIATELRPGDELDRFEVIPPDGYYAVPQFIDVPEHEQATILIYPYLGG